ncbi:hypothetical protein D3C80_1231530 [compost metagenome]
MPAVASTIVPPGFSQPCFSAASIMARAMRSLMEPPGFWLSSFRNRRQGPVSIRVTSIIGVLPIRSSKDFAGRDRTGASVIDIRDKAPVCVPERKLGAWIVGVNSRKFSPFRREARYRGRNGQDTETPPRGPAR